jgi:exonuclease SbcD
MRLLHTGDWHVGKQLRGAGRADEHRAVLDEIVGIAAAHEVDLVVVAGDLFDTAAPAPEAQGIVYDTLLRLAAGGTEVVVIAGNHDNARALGVLTPLFARSGVRIVSEPLRPDAGGVHRFTAADGAPVNVALLPFVSKRGIVRAEQLMSTAAFEQAQAYSQRMHQLIGALSAPFGVDAVNVLVAHAFVHGGQTGGGERAAHLVEEYAVLAPSFPATAGYVALGHLHRAQQIAGATAIHYPGSPLQLDFGETSGPKQVNVVELEPGLPARVSAVELGSGRPLRSYTGTLDQLAVAVADDDAWLRLIVREAHRAGLGQEVRERFGDRVVDVRIEAPAAAVPARPPRQGRSPHELFAEYMATRRVEDPRVAALFAELLDELTTEGSAS